MAFHDVSFPRYISRGAGGGPRRADEIATTSAGFEERNSPWTDSRRSYDAGIGLRNLDDLHTVIEFFEGRRGRLHGFRWWDPADFKSCPPLQTPSALDQAIGTGDAVILIFPLAKTYDIGGALPWTRSITLPVVATVLVAVDGVTKTEGVDYTVDHLTGLVTMTAAPADTLAVTAGFEFDTPVRFDSQSIAVNVRDFQNGAIPAIPVIEILR